MITRSREKSGGRHRRFRSYVVTPAERNAHMNKAREVPCGRPRRNSRLRRRARSARRHCKDGAGAARARARPRATRTSPSRHDRAVATAQMLGDALARRRASATGRAMHASATIVRARGQRLAITTSAAAPRTRGGAFHGALPVRSAGRASLARDDRGPITADGARGSRRRRGRRAPHIYMDREVGRLGTNVSPQTATHGPRVTRERAARAARIAARAASDACAPFNVSRLATRASRRSESVASAPDSLLDVEILYEPISSPRKLGRAVCRHREGGLERARLARDPPAHWRRDLRRCGKSARSAASAPRTRRRRRPPNAHRLTAPALTAASPSRVRLLLFRVLADRTTTHRVALALSPWITSPVAAMLARPRSRES